MCLISPLYSLFEKLNYHGIHYCIIRDFASVEQVNMSSDIDVVVKKSEKKIVRAILKELGWHTPSVNLSLYGHEQYYKWDSSRLVILDIVWDIFYSDGKYELFDQNEVYYEMGKLNIANIPRVDIAIKLLILHLLFDKNDVSEKNYNQLKRLYAIVNKQSGLIYEIASCIIEKVGISSDCAIKWKQQIIKTGILKPRISFYIKPKREMKVLINAVKRRLRLSFFFCIKHNPVKVAIMGVDGAGKSSTIQKLNEYYKGSCVQYMGFREDSWESPLAKRWLYLEKQDGFGDKLLRFIKFHVAIIYEGYYRYKKALDTGACIILFDRYYSERCNNWSGIGKYIYLLFLKLLYPKPDLVFYLHCSIEESLRRKDDIDDVDEFIQTKNKWDKIYIPQKSVIAIDTSKLNENDVLGIIIEKIASF